MSSIPGTLIGYTATGTAAGIGVTAAANVVSDHIPTTSKDTGSSHNGLIGDNWGFIKTGAGVGGAIALASAGITIAARRPSKTVIDTARQMNIHL